MEENWKPVAGYEGYYEVSDLGRVRSLNYNHTGEVKILKSKPDKDGYLIVSLSNNGMKKYCKLHRLVALAFVDGHTDDENQVNHINELKDDNRAVNLEWCDVTYNLNYGQHNEKMIKSLSIPIVQLTLDYKFVAMWPSAMVAQKQGGFHKHLIAKCCKHKYKSTGGYRWFYLKEFEEICFKCYISQHPFRLGLPYNPNIL